MVDTKHRKRQTPQLRVVFDTNILYTGSASDLVRQEAAKLIKESVFPDLEIQWYLPDIVRHERQFQMQKKAVEMLPTIERLETLLGHNLAITQHTLIESVEKAVNRRHEELRLVKLALDPGRVDWNRLSLDSAYRKAPFKDGETEKGFRDCLIIESFLQLVADSPKTPHICRIVLVSGDTLLTQAAKDRTSASTNVRVISTLEDLKGLINTLVSQVDENFLALLKPKAGKLFFTPKDQTTLYFKEQVRDKLSHKFAAELITPPSGATDRTNGTWRISPPNFVRKTGRRIHWTSKIEIEVEATKTTPQSPGIEAFSSNMIPIGKALSFGPFVTSGAKPVDIQRSAIGSTIEPLDYGDFYTPGTGLKFTNFGEYAPSPSTVKTHKGIAVYEVLWGADVTTSRDLRRPSIDEIRHVNTIWEPVT